MLGPFNSIKCSQKIKITHVNRDLAADCAAMSMKRLQAGTDLSMCVVLKS